MTKIKHRFINYNVSPKTEILVVGTFNPETKENIAEFFYGRGRNYLWTLVPIAWGEESLKGKSVDAKKTFIDRAGIDFIDLIKEVDVDEVSNYDDNYLDRYVTEWNDVVGVMDSLLNLRKVCMTRKHFLDVPNMRRRVEEIKSYCEKRSVKFQALVTPARFYNEKKQQEWSEFFKS